MVSARKVVREVLLGVLEGLIYVVLYVYIVPLLFSYIYQAGTGALAQQLMSPQLLRPLPTSELILIVALFEALSVSSSLLRDHVMGAFFRSMGSALGLAFILYLVQTYMPGGVMTSTVSLSSLSITITISLYPLLLVFVVAIALPGLIVPFIEYFMERGERE